MKVMTILGTRPEIIRLSQVIKKLDEQVNHILVHTGQNYDRNLSDVFFSELGLRAPDVALDVKAATLGQQLAMILEGTEKILEKERPDAVVILGDTNSAMATIMAKRLHIPTFHLEAGNRCYDDRVPEEVNRRIVDHTADVNLVYTQHAKLNLMREGLRPDKIIVTGSPLPEIFRQHEHQIDASTILSKLNLRSGQYFLVSLHREENVDDPGSLHGLLEAVAAAAKALGKRALVSTHPRTRRRLDNMENVPEGIEFHEPFGFFDYVHLQKHASCCISDSGTIHEDAAILGIPSVVIRESTERPEAIDAGAVVLVGKDKETLIAGIQFAVQYGAGSDEFQVPADYQVQNFSDRVVAAVVGQAKLVHDRTWGPRRG